MDFLCWPVFVLDSEDIVARKYLIKKTYLPGVRLDLRYSPDRLPGEQGAEPPGAKKWKVYRQLSPALIHSRFN